MLGDAGELETMKATYKVDTQRFSRGYTELACNGCVNKRENKGKRLAEQWENAKKA